MVKYSLLIAGATLSSSLILIADTAWAAQFTIFNTGVDNSGTVLPNNAVDPHYIITSAPPSISTPGLTYAVAAHPAWIPNSSVSKWIGAIPDAGNIGSPTGTYVYQTIFDLTGFIPSTAQLSGLLASDNNILDVLINGTSTGITTPFVGFTSFQPFSVTSGFVDGINTIEFILNAGGTVDALRVEFTSATADAVVPEPLTILGAGTALGLGTVFKRQLSNKQQKEKTSKN
ncbi:PEP-CTERM sorting domain-containing protein [Gloeothece verrucosa]|uniref:PEP-CTERM protein-sorting domain-containing protein n=1 Tax=Gloeothece verrucosa (strain PCC 7822) TaxID=497965 RepID=E0U8Z2_GLOV7|nr:PEP-CTERM sorting domain-containing protein [Gloeothece verrucosa]ADN16131.1 protein of unknown function DUF1555 [Gloeothece verrucosa PCC 7822]